MRGLVRSWRRALEAENKSERTIRGYVDGAGFFADWPATLDDSTDPQAPASFQAIEAVHVRAWMTHLTANARSSGCEGRAASPCPPPARIAARLLWVRRAGNALAVAVLDSGRGFDVDAPITVGSEGRPA